MLKEVPALSTEQARALGRCVLRLALQAMEQPGYAEELKRWCMETYGVPYEEARLWSPEAQLAKEKERWAREHDGTAAAAGG